MSYKFTKIVHFCPEFMFNALNRNPGIPPHSHESHIFYFWKELGLFDPFLFQADCINLHWPQISTLIICLTTNNVERKQYVLVNI